ncbi:hypothetical protein C2S52_000576 [Perilla frutescens var. hirtella]|nr:hypothetical protein C2S51_007843 [Perilla frutescens var. frutescens]KAH6800112.1 hypothetical protein C2S52_000576 [Perilla frutescens var. hirtella]
MNEKLDQLGDVIAVLQRQIAIRFGKENQSSPLLFIPKKPYVATSIDAPLLNSLSTPILKSDHSQTQSLLLEQNPMVVSALMLDCEDRDEFAESRLMIKSPTPSPLQDSVSAFNPYKIEICKYSIFICDLQHGRINNDERCSINFLRGT